METDTIPKTVIIENDPDYESPDEIIDCHQCHYPNKILKGSCAYCQRCGAKIGTCDE